MARPSRKGGKTSEAKTRKGGPAKDHNTTKTKRPIAPAATPVKRRSVSDPSKDLKEAREQQAATAEILKVIASSPDDVQPVFEAIAARSNQLVGGLSAMVGTIADETLHLRAFTPVSPKADAALKSMFPFPLSEFPWRDVILRGVPFAIKDIDAADPLPPLAVREMARLRGYRSMLFVPLMRDGNATGMISVTRERPGAFADHHVKLLRTFADQAVIAIENARLFNETQEALERQTATADILRVIASSPSDVQPVFEAIVSSAAKLFEPCGATITTLKDGKLHWAATAASVAGFDVERTRSIYPIPFDPDRVPSARAILDRRIIKIPDVAAPDTPEFTRKAAAASGFRSITYVPLIDQDQGIGTIILSCPQTGFRFSERQLAIIQAFADQAVIAIQNARLFNETQEALERQTATAEILKVIASSPSDVQPVFEAIATSANRLVGGFATAVFRFLDSTVHLAAFTPVSPAADAALKGDFPRPVDEFEAFRLAQHGKPFPIPDTEEIAHAPIREIARLQGFRSMLYVPLMNDGVPIGVISVTRVNPGSFADHQVQLLQTFADQAVIAIGNVRLFDEVQAKTRDLTESLQQQTATADVLQVISSSPGDLAPVFDKMLENAIRVCGAEFGSMNLAENGAMRPVAQCNVPAQYAAVRFNRVFTPHPRSPLAESIRTGQVVHVADLRTTEAYLERSPTAVELVELGGARTVAIVPMLRDDEVVGAITIFRNEVQLFSDKQIELLSNFAKQAVIAIENARLLKELRQRTDDLSQSLDDLRTAQDRLIQTEKLASLGQLTAGIAHEIKNPLNFVNNFSALSAELTDELNDVLKPVAMDGKVRGEVDELTGLLKGNLEKVLQHGKRADSIVKNMLLHSREGSREHRPADINSLLDESLNLAYHGARAEKGEFNITLQRDFDADTGTIELFPQEITRAFLNLIANGVYAATKRKTEEKEPGFEPTLRATTKNLGTSVEIRIRDNGTGIPPEVQEKMFNPFFTTKPAGEGTGLGLSMTHDIIVKQHGGRIDVATEPGQFTEFIIVLPRMTATGKAGADK